MMTEQEGEETVHIQKINVYMLVNANQINYTLKPLRNNGRNDEGMGIDI